MSEEIVKVSELAKELKLKSKDVVEILKNTTGAVKTVSSSLTDEEADSVIFGLTKEPVLYTISTPLSKGYVASPN